MASAVKARTNTKSREMEPLMPVAAPRKGRLVRSGKKERILIEFSESLLKRTDEVASRMEKSRSELIRTAVENLLEMEEKQRFEQQLASAYAANAKLSLELAEEFAVVDREGI
jgi:predicted transcriptional regulator